MPAEFFREGLPTGRLVLTPSFVNFRDDPDIRPYEEGCHGQKEPADHALASSKRRTRVKAAPTIAAEGVGPLCPITVRNS